MHLVQDWRAFRSLTADRRLLIAEAMALTGLIWLGLRIVSFANLRRTLDACSKRVLPGSQTPATAIGWAVHAATRRFPVKRTCLVEALAADVMLRRRQHDSALRLGVRKTDDHRRPLDGHAWVECDGIIVVGDLENLEEYSEGAWSSAAHASTLTGKT